LKARTIYCVLRVPTDVDANTMGSTDADAEAMYDDLDASMAAGDGDGYMDVNPVDEGADDF
jgi:hypothetical protein